MLVFDRVSKVYRTPRGETWTLRDASFEIGRGEALGLVGVNGAGKSTLLRMMAGVEHPTRGRIRRGFSVSWPLGFSDAFQSSLTGADNARFIARIYGLPHREVIEQVEDFARLGAYLNMPVRTYSTGMKARLSFAVSLAVDFDCWLVDEITAVGDASFQARCHEELWRRRERSTLIMVSHAFEALQLYCTRGATLIDGEITFYDTIEQAIGAYCDRYGIAWTPPAAPAPPESPAPDEPPPPRVSREQVMWCYRILLGREPENEAIVEEFRQAPDLDSLVTAFLHSEEFRRAKAGSL